MLTAKKIFGGHSEEVTPVPIPNTEVKLFSADGTAWETAWESRSPPELIYKPLDLPITDQGAFLFIIISNHFLDRRPVSFWRVRLYLSLFGRGSGGDEDARRFYFFLTYNLEMICFIPQKGISYIYSFF